MGGGGRKSKFWGGRKRGKRYQFTRLAPLTWKPRKNELILLEKKKRNFFYQRGAHTSGRPMRKSKRRGKGVFYSTVTWKKYTKGKRKVLRLESSQNWGFIHEKEDRKNWEVTCGKRHWHRPSSSSEGTSEGKRFQGLP